MNVIFFGDETENEDFHIFFLSLARRRRKILLFYIILHRFPLILGGFGTFFFQPHQNFYIQLDFQDRECKNFQKKLHLNVKKKNTGRL